MNLQQRYHPYGIECGVDEAGRGCLAGPVFAAAVILPPDHVFEGLDDSKKVCVKTREKLRIEIENHALAWAVASCSHADIDKMNILQASIHAMHLAISKLPIIPDLLLIDGNRFNPFHELRHICVVRGDATFASIAAASILAKTHRDEYMERFHQEYPEYAWAKNKGYPTATHINALRQFGPSPYHRRTFVLKGQTRLPI